MWVLVIVVNFFSLYVRFCTSFSLDLLRMENSSGFTPVGGVFLPQNLLTEDFLSKMSSVRRFSKGNVFSQKIIVAANNKERTTLQSSFLLFAIHFSSASSSSFTNASLNASSSPAVRFFAPRSFTCEPLRRASFVIARRVSRSSMFASVYTLPKGPMP